MIPEPYIVAADGIHLVRDDGAGYARVAWAWLFPVAGVRRPGRGPAGRAGLAGRPPVGDPADPPGAHQERPQADRRGRGRRPAGDRGRGQAGRTLARRRRGRQPAGDAHAIRSRGSSAGRPTARRSSPARTRPGGSSPGTPTRPPRSPRTGPTAPWPPGRTPSPRPATIWSSRSARTRAWRPRCCSRSGSTRSPSTSPAGRPAARPSRRWSR